MSSNHRKERRRIALELLTAIGILTETATRILSPDWELDDLIDADDTLQRHTRTITDAHQRIHALADQLIREEQQQ